jgi:hypothetical protein
MFLKRDVFKAEFSTLTKLHLAGKREEETTAFKTTVFIHACVYVCIYRPIIFGTTVRVLNARLHKFYYPLEFYMQIKADKFIRKSKLYSTKHSDHHNSVESKHVSLAVTNVIPLSKTCIICSPWSS